MKNSALGAFDSRHAMRHVRVYPHPIERVWEAVTTAEHLNVWLLPTCTVESRVGGKATFTWGGTSPDDEAQEFTIIEFDPPRVVDYGGLRFELEAVEGGTRLAFIQTFPPDFVQEPAEWPGGEVPAPGAPWQPGFCAGFHEMLDRLDDYLRGEWAYEQTLAAIKAYQDGDPESHELIEDYRKHIANECPKE